MNFADRDEWGFDELHDAVDILLAKVKRLEYLEKYESTFQVYTRGKFDPKRYEGHMKGPWKIYYDSVDKTGWYIDSIARYDVNEGDTVCQLQGTACKTDPTNRLIEDAPLLLAEVERLREGIEQALEAMSSHKNHRVYNSSWNILKELIG